MINLCELWQFDNLVNVPYGYSLPHVFYISILSARNPCCNPRKWTKLPFIFNGFRLMEIWSRWMELLYRHRHVRRTQESHVIRYVPAINLIRMAHENYYWIRSQPPPNPRVKGLKTGRQPSPQSKDRLFFKTRWPITRIPFSSRLFGQSDQ